MKTPVLIICYNRPEYLAKLIPILKAAKVHNLYFACDGPKRDSLEDIIRVRETRKLIDEIDWKCNKYKLYSSHNVGCRLGVTKAIDWFFSNIDSGIILEDDCLPTVSFFKFSTEMLKKYRHNESVMMVSGTNYLSDKSLSNSDYFFSKYYAIWGWATWKRAWEKYDRDMVGWGIKSNMILHQNYHSRRIRKGMQKMFKLAYLHQIDTWDIQWFFTCIMNNAYAIVPRRNMISNIGLNGSHSGNDDRFMNMPRYELRGNIKHPRHITLKRTYDELLLDEIYKDNIKDMIRSFIVKYFPRILSIILTLVHKYRLIINDGVIDNHFNSNYDRNALIVYTTLPFTNYVARKGNSHQSHWQVYQMAQIINKLKYNVDIIDYSNKSVKLTKLYDLVVDIHPSKLLPYKDNISKNTIMVGYLTGNNPTFSNIEEIRRINRVNNKFHKIIRPTRKSEIISNIIEKFNAVVIMGNKFTEATYAPEYNFSETWYIHNTAIVDSRNISNKRGSSFLYLGGRGQVHKGLDLVIEAFAKLKEHELYICSPAKSERDFFSTYSRIINNSKNIHYIGNIQIDSYKFSKIVEKCSYIILPSCSEACPGSIVNGLGLGLTPIITDTCGIDVNIGIQIKNNELINLSRIISNVSKIKSYKTEKNIIKNKLLASRMYSKTEYISKLGLILSRATSNDEIIF